MNAPARRNGGRAACAAILIVAATVTAAHARIGGLNMGGQTMHGMTMAPASRDGWTGYGPRVAPPVRPPCIPNRGRNCPSASSDQGGGGTGGFSPGGGSGTKPIKKPNLQ